MGIVKEAVEEVVEFTVDAVKDIFGPSRHTSGPRRTYRKQHEWDSKCKDYQEKQSQLEAERALFIEDSGRVSSLTAKKEELKKQLRCVEEKLAGHRKKIKAEQERMRVEQERNICDSVMDQCLRCARQIVENINDNCPQLIRITEEMAAAYRAEIQQKTKEKFKELEKSQHLKVNEKLAKQRGYQEAVSQKQQLQDVIAQLSALQTKIK